MIVKTKDNNGNDIEIVVISPGTKIVQDAQMQYSLKMSELMRKSINSTDKLLSRHQLDKYLSELGIWSKEDNIFFATIQIKIRDMEKKLMEGGIKISEAKKIALDMRNSRNILLTLYNKRAHFDEITMESIAEQYRFRFLVTKCVMDAKTKEPLFKDIEDYINRQDEQMTIDGAKELASVLFGYNKDFTRSLPENRWLAKFGLGDNDGNLIDKCGNLVDENGKRVDQNNRFIDDDGNFIDINGNPVDEKGELIIKEAKPFLDDETGNPIEIKKEKKKKGR